MNWVQTVGFCGLAIGMVLVLYAAHEGGSGALTGGLALLVGGGGAAIYWNRGNGA